MIMVGLTVAGWTAGDALVAFAAEGWVSAGFLIFWSVVPARSPAGRHPRPRPVERAVLVGYVLVLLASSGVAAGAVLGHGADAGPGRLSGVSLLLIMVVAIAAAVRLRWLTSDGDRRCLDRTWATVELERREAAAGFFVLLFGVMILIVPPGTSSAWSAETMITSRDEVREDLANAVLVGTHHLVGFVLPFVESAAVRVTIAVVAVKTVLHGTLLWASRARGIGAAPAGDG